MNDREALEFVRAWRWDDEELRIPGNDWGHQLAEAIDRLLEMAAQPTVTITTDRVPPHVRAAWVGEGVDPTRRQRGILLQVDAHGTVLGGELSSKVPAHEVIEVVWGTRLHRRLSDTYQGGPRG